MDPRSCGHASNKSNISTKETLTHDTVISYKRQIVRQRNSYHPICDNHNRHCDTLPPTVNKDNATITRTEVKVQSDFGNGLLREDSFELNNNTQHLPSLDDAIKCNLDAVSKHISCQQWDRAACFLHHSVLGSKQGREKLVRGEIQNAPKGTTDHDGTCDANFSSQTSPRRITSTLVVEGEIVSKL